MKNPKTNSNTSSKTTGAADGVTASFSAAFSVGVSAVQAHVLRLTPGQDLYAELARYAKETNASYSIGTCVGSLSEAFMRMPGENVATHFAGPFEIVSLVGTLTADGVHLHIAVSDRVGQVRGGHLKEKSLIHTTAEIVLFELLNLHLQRKHDDKTGYPELVIQRRV